MAERLQALSTAAITQYLAQYHQAQAAMAAFQHHQSQQQQQQQSQQQQPPSQFPPSNMMNFGGGGVPGGALPTNVEELAFINNFLVKLGEQIASGEYYGAGAGVPPASQNPFASLNGLGGAGATNPFTPNFGNPLGAGAGLGMGVGGIAGLGGVTAAAGMYDPQLLAQLGLAPSLGLNFPLPTNPNPNSNSGAPQSQQQAQSQFLGQQNPAPAGAFNTGPGVGVGIGVAPGGIDFPSLYPALFPQMQHQHMAAQSSSSSTSSSPPLGSGSGHGQRRSASGTPEFDYAGGGGGGALGDGPPQKRASSSEEARAKRSRLDSDQSSYPPAYHHQQQHPQQQVYGGIKREAFDSPPSSSQHSPSSADAHDFNHSDSNSNSNHNTYRPQAQAQPQMQQLYNGNGQTPTALDFAHMLNPGMNPYGLGVAGLGNFGLGSSLGASGHNNASASGSGSGGQGGLGVSDAARREHVPRLGAYDLGPANGRPLVHSVPKLQTSVRASASEGEAGEDAQVPSIAVLPASSPASATSPSTSTSSFPASHSQTHSRSGSSSSTSSSIIPPYPSLTDGDSSLKLPALRNISIMPRRQSQSSTASSSSAASTATLSPNATPRTGSQQLDDDDEYVSQSDGEEDTPVGKERITLPGVSSILAAAAAAHDRDHGRVQHVEHITGDMRSIALRSAPGTPHMPASSAPAPAPAAKEPVLTPEQKQRREHAALIGRLLVFVNAEFARRNAASAASAPSPASTVQIDDTSSAIAEDTVVVKTERESTPPGIFRRKMPIRSSSPVSDSDSESGAAEAREPSRYRRSAARYDPESEDEDEDEDGNEEGYVPGATSLYPELRPPPILRRIYAQ